MTMIGLGVGAFEILKQQGQKGRAGGFGEAPPPSQKSGNFGVSTPPPAPGAHNVPPPPPVSGNTPVALPPVSAPAATASPNGSEQLAVRMIQVMVAAAHADGTMDQEEEKAVLDKLRGAGLDQDEKMFLLDELHRPQSIEALTAGISDPSVAKTMYMLAVAGIAIDTEAERVWLDRLAQKLGLSKELQAFIEER